MSELLLLGVGSRVVPFGPREAPNAIKWYAKDGLLHWVDERDGSHGTVTRRDFLVRLLAINSMLQGGKRDENKNVMHRDEVERHMRFIEDAQQLVKEARTQGDPMIPSELLQKVQDEKKITSIGGLPNVT